MLDDMIIEDKLKEIQDNLDTIKVIKDYDILQQEIGILTDKLKDSPEILHTEIYTQEDLDNIEKKLQERLEKKELIITNKPFKPIKTLCEFDNWNNKYNEWVYNISKKYGSVEDLLKLVRDNTVLKPTIEEGTLKSQKDMFYVEVSSIDDWENWVDNVDDISQKRDHIIDKKIKLEDELKCLKEKLSINSEELRNHMRNPVVKPIEEEEDYDSFMETFDEYNKEISSVEKRLSKCNRMIEDIKILDAKILIIENDIIRNKKDINIIVSAQHPYNDNCWACKQQTWKVHLVKLEENTNELEKELCIFKNKRLELLGKRDLDTLMNLSNDYNEYIQNWKELRTNKIDWDKIKIQWNKYKPYQEILSCLEERETELNNKIKEIEKVIVEILIKEKYISREYELSLRCRENFPRWKSTLKMITEQEKLWVDYNASLSLVNDINITQKYLEEEKDWEIIIDQYNLYDSWEIKLNSIEGKCNRLEGKRDEIRIYLYSIQLDSIKKELENYNEKNRLNSALDYWRTVKNIKVDYLYKLDMKVKIDTLKIEEKKLSEDYHKTKILYNVSKKLENDEVINNKLKSNLLGMKSAIEHIHGKLSGFRKWLYDVKVMPRLLAETNRIISSVTNSTDLKLEVVVDASKPKTSLSWYIKHGVNRPHIEKASGFQRWMFGLGIRISMAFLGASVVSCDQIFIDEGFVACDTEHLSRVPDFLEDLLKKYKTVVLVSHLEEIKNCASIKIPIKREKDLSTIQFGQKVIVEIEKKKRGRPAKKV
jgi:DNA repair exonuclease SbcCD ATPase subunit